MWYEKAMTWAKENGISDGSIQMVPSPGAACHDAVALRGQSLRGRPSSSFGDSASVSAYATEALRWAVGEGLISSTDAGLLASPEQRHRAQVATILMRFVESLTK